MLAGPPGHEELDAKRVRLDLHARCELAASRAAATASGEHQPELLGWIDRTTTPRAPSARIHEFRIDQSDRVVVAPVSRDRQRVRAQPLLVAVTVSIGLASVGIPVGYFFSRPNAASSELPTQSTNVSAGIPNSTKGDRLRIDQTTVRATDREAAARLPQGPNLSASTTIVHWKPPAAAASPARSAGSHSTAAQPPPPLPAAKPHIEARLTAPVPETRPTTIDGWRLREVVDGTAVLEGPGGIVKVRRGDTVPGVGKVVAIIRWGNRMVVATSKGLISTP